MPTVTIGSTFGQALCKHFGLPLDQVSQHLTVNAGVGEIFGVTLDIALTGDDVMYIGKIMKESK